MTRKEAREQAFILMFEYSFSGDSAEELFDIAKEAGLDIDDEFCTRAVSAAIQRVAEIDEIIGKYSKGWKAERLARVTLAALRLALAEMLTFDDIPVSVSINEAVELIKKYATEQDAAFANGILGSYSRTEKDL